MNTIQSPTPGESQSNLKKNGNRQLMQVIRYISWAVTLIFLLSLVWAIYQALVTRNTLPAWVWLGIVVLFAAAAGLVVMVIVYRGVAEQVGPFDLRPAEHFTGELKNESRRVEAGGASTLRAEIKMMEGVLQLVGGATDMAEADFTYDDADWKPPEVQYSIDPAGQGSLEIEQKTTHRPAMRQGRCEWKIRLNGDLPTDLSAKFGAGKAELHLGELALTRLRVESGVGALEVDLSGELRQSLEAFIKAGIGDTVLRLPQNAGVHLLSSVDFGSLHQQGLTWDGSAYTNTAYGKSPVTLDVVLESGMGKITVLSPE